MRSRRSLSSTTRSGRRSATCASQCRSWLEVKSSVVMGVWSSARGPEPIRQSGVLAVRLARGRTGRLARLVQALPELAHLLAIRVLVAAEQPAAPARAVVHVRDLVRQQVVEHLGHLLLTPVDQHLAAV